MGRLKRYEPNHSARPRAGSRVAGRALTGLQSSDAMGEGRRVHRYTAFSDGCCLLVRRWLLCPLRSRYTRVLFVRCAMYGCGGGAGGVLSSDCISLHVVCVHLPCIARHIVWVRAPDWGLPGFHTTKTRTMPGRAHNLVSFLVARWIDLFGRFVR